MTLYKITLFNYDITGEKYETGEEYYLSKKAAEERCEELLNSFQAYDVKLETIFAKRF